MRALVKSFLPVIVILVAVVGFVVLRMTRPEPPPAGEEERRWPIAVVEIAPGDFAPEVRIFGELISQTDATLRARTAGDVAEIFVREGQRVSKGELLLRLDDLDARAAYQQRKAELEDFIAQQEQLDSQHEFNLQALSQEEGMLVLAERQFDRMRQLAKAERASQREVDEAELALNQQRLTVMSRQLAIGDYTSRHQQLKASIERASIQKQLAERDLKAAELRAPADLRVQEILVGKGDRVATNEALLRIFVPEQLEMQSRLPVTYVRELQAALNEQQPLYAKARVDGEALVFRLQELAGHTLDTAGVRANFTLHQGSPEGLALGRFVDAQLVMPTVQAVYWLPVDAVQGRNRVYRVVDNRLDGLNVELKGDLTLEGRPGVLVASKDLQEGDQLLANRLPNAMQSLLVEVVEKRDLAAIQEAAE